MNSIVEDILMHYGMPRRSGRYPYGSGENPYQHSGDFLSRVQELKKSGMSETDIAKNMGLTTTQLRTQMSLAKDERRALQVATAKGLREKGYSLNEIADKMGFANDSSVRSLLNETSENRMNQAKATADVLRKLIEEKGMIDVGTGVERELGVSKEKLNQALYMLELEGYPIYGGGVPQVTNPGKQTNIKVICPPGTEHKDIYDFENVHSVRDYISYDNGESFRKSFEYPASMDSKRLQIRYADQGGVDKDGVIELRRGVKDLSLGDSHYAQVRIMVDGTHYLKGMAVYSDNMPDGVDVIFNTNKKSGTPTKDVLKKIKDDPDNPFGSLIKEHGGQSYYDDPKGKYTDPVTGKKQSLSLINKRAEEGDWGEWSKTLPSQFLSKQSLTLIKKQLGLAKADKQAEYDEICSLTNPTVKKALLKSFADDCDAAAVHLQAAALPRQKYQVILPLTTIKDNEVYAPNYKDGETVALIRYPHGGTFEIPILKVNNKLAEGKSVLGNTPADAIGINKKNADRLSGADFDGDTVMVIPCNSTKSKVKITSTSPLKGLEGFDTKDAYGGTVKKDADGVDHYYRNGKEYKIMRNIKITIEYDGSRYQGWTRLGKDESNNTISAKIIDVLGKMTGEKNIELNCGCRTEVGVHAYAQVANFKTSSNLSTKDIQHYLNRYLPMDIAITEVEEVPDRFHAQLNAVSKTYVYRMTIMDVPSVFERKHTYHCFKTPDKKAMQQAALLFIGEHDFRNFSTAKKSKNTTREVYDIDIYGDNEEMQILIQADDFLHNMARLMIGTLLDIGFGLRKKEDIEAIFNGEKTVGNPCDPKGLYLQEVEY